MYNVFQTESYFKIVLVLIMLGLTSGVENIVGHELGHRSHWFNQFMA